jgi:hypothetical protein
MNVCPSLLHDSPEQAAAEFPISLPICLHNSGFRYQLLEKNASIIILTVERGCCSRPI